MTDEEKIAVRILDVLPPGSFELSTFLRLFRIKFSNEVETAAVTCTDAPTLLLNRDFVAAHCQTDEHLFMLVMHELYHVILGHTTLFPRATKVRNLVFDAVINALLCSLFPDPAFTSFFTDYYPADQMPFALLRPPGAGTPPAAQSALRLLYGTSGDGTYHDVYEALLASDCMKEVTLLLPGEDGKPLLLGSHDGANEEVSQEMKDLIHKIISKWPSPDRPLQGQDLGAAERVRDFDAEADPAVRLRRGIRRLMRRAALPGQKEIRRRALRETVCETSTFLPDWHDRAHEARVIAFGDALVYGTTTRLRRPSSRDSRQAFVYFDVSGSVADRVPSVAQALLPSCRSGLCTVHVFSTVVHPASVRDLAARKFSSTGGTDIDCVLRHVLELPPRKRPRAAIVITDGFTGTPDATLAARFRAAGMRLFIGLVKTEADGRQEADLSSIAEKFVNLF